jgi:flagellin
MAIYVNSNISSLTANSNLNKSVLKLNSNYQKLSSGYRINSAKDDAAGLGISDRLTAQINGLKQGNRNANDGIALAQTAEGALDETTSMLQRIRTLAEQAATGTLTAADRTSIQDEVTALSDEITRIACKTSFGGQQILAGTSNGLIDANGKVGIQVGAYANEKIDIDFGSVAFSVAGLASANGAGAAPTGVLDASGTHFDVSDATKAQATLGYIDNVINYVDSRRSQFGAVQNRFESTIRNQDNIANNVTDARSRIRDTDYAEETAEYTANQIRQQVASAILTQANAKPQLALSLLG